MTDSEMKPGLYWHVHHEVLFEYCYNYAERVAYIKSNKPKHEQSLRLKLFQPIRGAFGDEQACDEGHKADAEWHKADAEWHKADDECRRAYDEWRNTFTQSEVEALHKAECKSCPWDGRTIFPTEK